MRFTQAGDFVVGLNDPVRASSKRLSVPSFVCLLCLCCSRVLSLSHSFSRSLALCLCLSLCLSPPNNSLCQQSSRHSLRTCSSSPAGPPHPSSAAAHQFALSVCSVRSLALPPAGTLTHQDVGGGCADLCILSMCVRDVPYSGSIVAVFIHQTGRLCPRAPCVCVRVRVCVRVSVSVCVMSSSAVPTVTSNDKSVWVPADGRTCCFFDGISTPITPAPPLLSRPFAVALLLAGSTSFTTRDD